MSKEVDARTFFSSAIPDYADTLAENARLREALQNLERALLPVASAIGAAGNDVWPEIAEALIRARAV